MKSRYIIFGLTALMLIDVNSATGQAPPSRSPEAAAALQRGFAMAQRQRWSLAIRYFRNAQKIAQTDPVVLFNLALANDRAAGRNIVATAWYRAYLAAVPNAKNAGTVQNRITDLEIATETIILDLIGTARAVSAQLKNKSKLIALARIAGAQAVSGDIASAQQTTLLLGLNSQAGWAQARIAAAHAVKGDAQTAHRIATVIKHRRARNWALAEIAVQQAIRKDFAGATNTAAAASIGPDRDFAFSRLAALQIMAGDIDGANASADKIGQNSATYRLIANAAAAIPMTKSELPWIADKARKYLRQAVTEAQGISDASSRQIALLQVIRAHAQINDINAAKRTAGLLADDRFKHLASQAIASARGDSRGAAIHRWSAVAAHASASPSLDDTAGMLDRAKTEDPTVAVGLIAAAAEERALFLKALRAP